jgi:protein kinase
VDRASGVSNSITISQNGNQISVSIPGSRGRSGSLTGNQFVVSGKGESTSPTIQWSGSVSPDGRTITGTATCKGASFPISLVKQ